MMKVVQINTSCGVGSTGKICVGISKQLTQRGYENAILYSSRTDGNPVGVPCATDGYIKMQALKSRLLGNYGFNSKQATRRMFKKLKELNPDLVHLHNIHGHDCHLGMLLSYLREQKIKVVWTFHDCWTLTAYCPHFSMAGCNKWQTTCQTCPQHKQYSWFFDKSRQLFQQKVSAFQGLDIHIVTPSNWLAQTVGQSFLKEVPVTTIHNGIDLDVFQPTKGDFRQKHGLQEKKIVLGVTFGWSDRKGLDVFIKLSKTLPEDYQVVLVGTDEKVQARLPENILAIPKTQNQQELAEIYTAADVFANPTREEVLGLTNIEANACGTPVLTFDAGGSPECVSHLSGSVVAIDDFDGFRNEIIRICETAPYTAQDCRARATLFDANARYSDYVDLYESLLAEK